MLDIWYLVTFLLIFLFRCLFQLYVCDCVMPVRSLCRSQWRHVSAYRKQGSPGFSFKKLYMQLDEATLTFNADVCLVGAIFLLTYFIIV